MAKCCFNTNRSEFHRVGAATENALVPTFVLILGTKLSVLSYRSEQYYESNIMIKGIAIVKSTSNKSSCNSFGDSKT